MSDQDTLVHVENPLARALNTPLRIPQILVGWALLALCMATVVEVVGRKLIGFSVQGVNEIGAYMLAISSTWGFSVALLQRAHARVDFLFPFFPKAIHAPLNALAAVLLAALAIFAAIQGWSVLSDTLRWQARASTPLQTPLWIPQGLWLAGLVLFSAVSAAMAVHALILLVRDRARLNRYYGPPSLIEQIEIETQGTLDLPPETLSAEGAAK